MVIDADTFLRGNDSMNNVAKTGGQMNASSTSGRYNIESKMSTYEMMQQLDLKPIASTTPYSTMSHVPSYNKPLPTTHTIPPAPTALSHQENLEQQVQCSYECIIYYF
jgi:hypothetical protein